mgnify:CR=1 FL=1
MDILVAFILSFFFIPETCCTPNQTKPYYYYLNTSPKNIHESRQQQQVHLQQQQYTIACLQNINKTKNSGRIIMIIIIGHKRDQGS